MFINIYVKWTATNENEKKKHIVKINFPMLLIPVNKSSMCLL